MKTCNANQKGVRWQCNIEKAKVKLHALYPITKWGQGARVEFAIDIFCGSVIIRLFRLFTLPA